MIINGKKTKEMLIGTASKVCMSPVILNDLPIERVDTFKLLVVYLSNDLKWEKHVNAVTSRVLSAWQSARVKCSNQCKKEPWELSSQIWTTMAHCSLPVLIHWKTVEKNSPGDFSSVTSCRSYPVCTVYSQESDLRRLFADCDSQRTMNTT